MNQATLKRGLNVGSFRVWIRLFLVIGMFGYSAMPGCALFDRNPMEDGQCDDGIDNDGDGRLDLADPQCDGDPNGREAAECSDGKDNDADGQYDTDDPGCLGDAQHETETEACRNDIDDDHDGQVDTEDWGCHNDSYGLNEDASDQDCDNGIDDDGDGKVDENDPQCGTVGEREAVQCDDLEDNDGDGAVDEDDLQCDPEIGYHVDDSEIFQCDNGVDDDGDNAVDLDDVQCGGNSDWDFEGTGGCIDGIDNDGDGYEDSDDPECFDSDYPSCNKDSEDYDENNQESGQLFDQFECSNGEDDDFNHDTDAADKDCLFGCDEEY